MYGKFNESGKFQAAPGVKKVTNEGTTTIIERYSTEELLEMGYKEVRMDEGEGRPGPGMRPNPSYEDKGDYILRKMNWTARN